MTKTQPSQEPDPPRRFETKQALAKRLGVSWQTIDSWRRQGVLTAYRPGGGVSGTLLFESAEVDAAILASADTYKAS